MCQRQRFWRLYYIVLRSLLNSSHEYFASIIYLDSLWIFWQFYGDDIILTTSYRVHFFDFYHFCVFLYVFIWPKMNSKILTMHIWLLYFHKNYFNIYLSFLSSLYSCTMPVIKMYFPSVWWSTQCCNFVTFTQLPWLIGWQF